MRPFEVGAMVISKKLGTGVVAEIHHSSDTGIAVFDWFSKESYSIETGIVNFTCGEKIITIRKPRPGSKEARDIVAMLLYRFRKFVQFYIFVSSGLKRSEDNELIKHYYQLWKKEHYLYQCYETAKSMLK